MAGNDRGATLLGELCLVVIRLAAHLSAIAVNLAPSSLLLIHDRRCFLTIRYCLHFTLKGSNLYVSLVRRDLSNDRNHLLCSSPLYPSILVAPSLVDLLFRSNKKGHYGQGCNANLS